MSARKRNQSPNTHSRCCRDEVLPKIRTSNKGVRSLTRKRGRSEANFILANDSSDSWPCYHPAMRNLFVLIHLYNMERSLADRRRQQFVRFEPLLDRMDRQTMLMAWR